MRSRSRPKTSAEQYSTPSRVGISWLDSTAAQQYPPVTYSCDRPSLVEATREANRSTLAQNRSTSASLCCGEMVHCSLLPHGAMNTPPLCCTRKCKCDSPV